MMDILKMLAIMTGSTLLAMLFNVVGFQEATIVIIFMLAVLVVTQVTSSFIYGASSSLLSVLIFNFFFTEPLFSFNIHQQDYIITFFILFVASFFSSTLTSKLKQANHMAETRYKQVALIDQINQTFNLNDIDLGLRKIAQLLSAHFNCPVRIQLEKDQIINVYEYGVIPEGSNVKTFSSELVIAQQESGLIQFITNESFSNEALKFSETLSGLIAQNIERQRLIKQQIETDFEIREQKLRNNLLGAISHDLRTPLATVIGSAETLIENEEKLSKDDRNLLLHNISEDAKWLIDSVENILSFIRVEEHLQLNLQLESIEELFGDVISHVVAHAKQHIYLDIPRENLMFKMDVRLMEKVLINLLNNSIKYSPENSSIILKAYQKKDSLVFEVIDQGRGVPDEMKSKIFNRFVTEEKHAPTNRKGLGLGLAICKAIVEAHNGRITVKDNLPSGSVFRCTFPYPGGSND